MTDLHTAARQALEALEQVEPYVEQLMDYSSTASEWPLNLAPQRVAAAIAALRAALEAQQEPAQPQGWVLVPAYLLQKAADVLEEATTYTHSESWSPSMTDELLALRQEMLAARPQPKEPQT